MKRLLPLLILLAAFTAYPRKQRTGPGRISPIPTAPAMCIDTIAADSASLRLSGYDKPNQAAFETFFVTNLTSDSTNLDGFVVTLTYFDSQGRQLHRRTEPVNVDLPAGETRSVRIATWDVNRAFHYYRSPAPVRRPSTPYSVKAQVISLLKAGPNAETSRHRE